MVRFRDLGVKVGHNLKTTVHSREFAAKWLKTLSAIRRTFTKLDTTMFITVYTILMRTKLENCVQTASPCLKSDSDIVT